MHGQPRGAFEEACSEPQVAQTQFQGNDAQISMGDWMIEQVSDCVEDMANLMQ